MAGYGSNPSLAAMAPLRVIIGQEDVTTYVADGMTFSNVDPGGYEMSSFQIPKDLPNTLRGFPIRIDSGLKVAWEGRISEVQRSLGSETTITGEGNVAKFKDNTLAQIFIDQDLTQWVGPSVQRQINLVAAGLSPSSGEVAADASTGNPSIALGATAPWTTGGLPQAEALYDAQGVPIHSVSYTAVFNAAAAAAPLTGQVYLATTDLVAVVDTSGPFTASTSGTLVASVNNRPFAVLAASYAAPAATSGELFAIYFDSVAVIGNHGLTNRGGGFYTSDIAAYVAGLIQGLQLGNVQQANGYVLPQSVYLTPVGMDQIISDMGVAAGWHWGVWESFSPLTGNPSPRFDFCPRPLQGASTAFCMRSACDKVDIKEDLSGQYNTAIVSYTDVAGASRAVTVTQDNPILDAAGIAQRSVVFNGGLMTKSVAQVFGLEALSLLYAQDRVSGTVEISGPVDGPGAPWLLKAGIDRLRIGDLPSQDAFGIYNDVPISRVETSASSSEITTTVEIGSGGNLVETLQSRLTSASVLAGQGGV